MIVERDVSAFTNEIQVGGNHMKLRSGHLLGQLQARLKALRSVNLLLSYRGSPIRSIGVRLFAMFLISALIGAIVVGAISYRVTMNALEQKMGDNASQVTRDTARDIDRWMSQIEGLFNQSGIYMQQNLFLLPDRQKLKPEEWPNFDENIRKYFSGITNANTMVQSMTILRSSHENVGYSRVNSTLVEKAFDQPWVQEAVKLKGANYWLPPRKGSYFNSDTQEFVFGFAKAYWNKEALQWSDVFVMEFRVSFIGSMLKDITFGGLGNLHLIDSGSVVIYANTEEFPFSSSYAAFRQIEPSDTYRIQSSHLLTEHRTEKYDWVVAGSIPMKALLEDMASIQAGFFAAIGLSLLAAAALGYWGYQYIGKPLIQARQTMRLAEDGDLQVRLPDRRKDEIGGVGASFNLMLERIGEVVEKARMTSDKLMDYTEQMNEQALRSRAASEEIVVAMRELAAGSSNLAHDAERSNELNGRLFAKLQQLDTSNKIMHSVTLQVSESSRKGADTMKQLRTGNRDAESNVMLLLERVEKLQEHTVAVNAVLDLLTAISRQINILALNASIVAAQSGENGRAFMVVAGEIRNLAGKSASSIESAAEAIERIRGDMDETSSLIASSGDIFKRQTMSVQASESIFNEVAAAMQQFLSSFEDARSSIVQSVEAQQELAAVMETVSAVSQEAAATTDQVSGLADRQKLTSDRSVEIASELEELSVALKDALQVFKS